MSITPEDGAVASKSEVLGGDIELQTWTVEAILQHLGPILDRARKVWKFKNGVTKEPPLDFVVPCGAVDYLPKSYGLALRNADIFGWVG